MTGRGSTTLVGRMSGESGKTKNASWKTVRMVSEAEEQGRRPLRSAQRFQAYLAAADQVALWFFVWNLFSLLSPTFNGSASTSGVPHSPMPTPGTAARLWVSLALRPTLLCFVACASWAHVRIGYTYVLGRRGWRLWLPVAGLVLLGSGFAAMVVWRLGGAGLEDESSLSGSKSGRYTGQRVAAAGLVVWNGTLMLITTVAFTSLLLAVWATRVDAHNGRARPAALVRARQAAETRTSHETLVLVPEHWGTRQFTQASQEFGARPQRSSVVTAMIGSTFGRRTPGLYTIGPSEGTGGTGYTAGVASAVPSSIDAYRTAGSAARPPVPHGPRSMPHIGAGQEEYQRSSKGTNDTVGSSAAASVQWQLQVAPVAPLNVGQGQGQRGPRPSEESHATNDLDANATQATINQTFFTSRNGSQSSSLGSSVLQDTPTRRRAAEEQVDAMLHDAGLGQLFAQPKVFTDVDDADSHAAQVPMERTGTNEIPYTYDHDFDFDGTFSSAPDRRERRTTSNQPSVSLYSGESVQEDQTPSTRESHDQRADAHHDASVAGPLSEPSHPSMRQGSGHISLADPAPRSASRSRRPLPGRSSRSEPGYVTVSSLGKEKLAVGLARQGGGQDLLGAREAVHSTREAGADSLSDREAFLAFVRMGGYLMGVWLPFVSAQA